MKNELKNLLDSKVNLKKNQLNFKEILNEKYPFLLTTNLQEYKRIINAELEFLLSSSTKTNSTRIKIPCKRIGYGSNFVVLTRKPGLKSPYSSYSAFELHTIDRINKEGDLFVREDYGGRIKKDEERIVNLSILKGSSEIVQEKLQAFYDFMNKSIVLMTEFHKFVPSYWNHESIPALRIGKHQLKFSNQGFDLEIFNENYKSEYNKWNSIEATSIIDYSPDQSSDENGIRNQKSLMIFFKDFELFDSILTVQELKKKELINKAKELITKLSEYNKPFKVLKKLLI